MGDIRLETRRDEGTGRVRMVVVVAAVGVIVWLGGHMGDFRKLTAWQKGHAFSMAVHAAFVGRKANKAPGLRAQILRAADSIPDNLAEGCAKRSRRELAKYADTS